MHRAKNAAATAAGNRRRPPELIDKAQRMYDSRQFTMAEIAASCAVTHDHLPQHPHDPGRSHTPPST